MRIYVSSASRLLLDTFSEMWPNEKLDVLKTFAGNLEEVTSIADKRPSCVKSLILDSGTYSINNDPTIEETRTVNNYREYLRIHKDKFDFYFNYDISFDGNDLINWEMQRILESPFPKPDQNPHLKAVPVIQNLDDVPLYCKLREKYPIVAIGSGANKKIKPLKEAVKKLYNSGIKVHLFAIGAYNKLHDIPVWSCDCTSFLQWASFIRTCYLDIDEDGNLKERILSTKELDKWGKISTNYLFDNSEHLTDKYGTWLTQKGLEDIYTIDFERDKVNHVIKLANLMYFKELAEIITEEHKARGFTFDTW